MKCEIQIYEQDCQIWLFNVVDHGRGRHVGYFYGSPPTIKGQIMFDPKCFI